MPELIQEIINTAMQAERQQYLKAEPYQYTEERQGHANGYKPPSAGRRYESSKLHSAMPQTHVCGACS